MSENRRKTKATETEKKEKLKQIQNWNQSSISKESTEYRPKKVQFDSTVSFLNACLNFDKNEINQMLKNGTDVNCSDDDNLTGLHQACINSNYELVKFLLDKGADVNVMDKECWTPLHVACEIGDLKLAEILINAGARLDKPNIDGDLPYHFIHVKSIELMKYIEKEMQRMKINVDECVNFERNMMLNDVKKWKDNNNYNPPVDNIYKSTPLHVAASKNYIEVITELLPLLKENDLNAQDIDGWTSLHAAAHWGHQDVCVILLKAGAKPGILTYLNESMYDLVEESLRDEFKRKMTIAITEINQHHPEEVVIRPQMRNENPHRRRSSIIRQSVELKKSTQMKDPKAERRALSQFNFRSDHPSSSSSVEDEDENTYKSDRRHSFRNLGQEYDIIQESDEPVFVQEKDKDIQSTSNNKVSSSDEVGSKVTKTSLSNINKVDKKFNEDVKSLAPPKTSREIIESNKESVVPPKLVSTDTDSSNDKTISMRPSDDVKLRSRNDREIISEHRRTLSRNLTSSPTRNTNATSALVSSISSASVNSNNPTTKHDFATSHKKMSLELSTVPITVDEVDTGLEKGDKITNSTDKAKDSSSNSSLRRCKTDAETSNFNTTLNSDSYGFNKKRYSHDEARDNICFAIGSKLKMAIKEPASQISSTDLSTNNKTKKWNITLPNPSLTSNITTVTSSSISGTNSSGDGGANKNIHSSESSSISTGINNTPSILSSSSDDSNGTLKTQMRQINPVSNASMSSVGMTRKMVSNSTDDNGSKQSSGSFLAKHISYNKPEDDMDNGKTSIRPRVEPSLSTVYPEDMSVTSIPVVNQLPQVQQHNSNDFKSISPHCPNSVAERLLSDTAKEQEMMKHIKELQNEIQMLKISKNNESDNDKNCKRCALSTDRKMQDQLTEELNRYKEENRSLKSQKDALLRVINKIQGDLENFHTNYNN